ncbi:MAG: hypothetical protein MH252_14110 [Thermosynechococcaceae cyanobacterium MS004]|nr:hypothetical protein [Thermosynechococcaceae cyanobacterium MS004]
MITKLPPYPPYIPTQAKINHHHSHHNDTNSSPNHPPPLTHVRQRLTHGWLRSIVVLHRKGDRILSIGLS